MMNLFLVLVSVVLMSRVDGFIFGSRRSSSVHQSVTHTNTNNCHCANQMHIGSDAMALLMKLFGKGFGKREVATMLDLEEDYPGLEQFMEHAGMKRDGTIDIPDFVSAVKRANTLQSQSNGGNTCHCGRMVVDQYNLI